MLTAERIVSAGGGGGGSKEQQTTAGVFDLPAGRYLIYAAGLAFLGVAGFNGYRAVTCKFNKKLKTAEMNDAEEAAATGVGVLGHLARAVVFALIGLFLLKAAWEFDPKEARGLDGALMELAQQAYGGAAARRGRRRPDGVRPLLLRRGALPPDLARRGR